MIRSDGSGYSAEFCMISQQMNSTKLGRRNASGQNLPRATGSLYNDNEQIERSNGSFAQPQTRSTDPLFDHDSISR